MQVSPENFGEAEARNAVPITRVIFHDSITVCLLLDPNKLSSTILELQKVEQNFKIIVFLFQKTCHIFIREIVSLKSVPVVSSYPVSRANFA